MRAVISAEETLAETLVYVDAMIEALAAGATLPSLGLALAARLGALEDLLLQIGETERAVL